MNGSTNSLVNTIIAICVAGGVIGGMYAYIGRDRSPAINEESGLTSQSVDTRVKDPIIESLERVSKVTFDESIFTDPLFVSLSDFAQPVQVQPEGRPNPFSPLPITATSSSVGDSAIRAVAPVTQVKR
jgi:hypothetical protein